MSLLRKIMTAIAIRAQKNGWVEPVEKEKITTRVIPYLSKEEKLVQVQKSGLTARPLLNQPEQELFRALSIFARDFERGSLRFSPQVSMGEYLMDTDETGNYLAKTEAFFAINDLRNDFCIFDGDWKPLVVLEYNGSGHHGDDENPHTTKRVLVNDEIKRTACDKAGILYFSLYPSQKHHDQMLKTLNIHVKPWLVAKLGEKPKATLEVAEACAG